MDTRPGNEGLDQAGCGFEKWRAAATSSCGGGIGMKRLEAALNRPIHFGAESFHIDESEGSTPSDYVDVDITVISTNVTGNGRQYTLEDLQANAARLNGEGGLIFAMGKHPDDNEEPNAVDNVGVGKVSVKDGKIVSTARIYNTATVPDMVKRIRMGLVRDVSIEGIAQKFVRTCNGDGCWQRAMGLTIHRAVFVSAGADPLAKIEKILESIECDVKTTEAATVTTSDAPIITQTATLEQVMDVLLRTKRMMETVITTLSVIAESAPSVKESPAPYSNVIYNYYEDVKARVR